MFHRNNILIGGPGALGPPPGYVLGSIRSESITNRWSRYFCFWNLYTGWHKKNGHHQKSNNFQSFI